MSRPASPPAPQCAAASPWEVGFSIITLILLTGAGLPLLRSDDSEAVLLDGDPLSQAIHVVIYGVALVLLLAQVGPGALRRLPLPVWALTALAVLSITWSDDPSLTMRRGVAVVGTTIVGFYLGSRYTLERQLRLIVCALALTALISVGFVWATPLGVMEGGHEGAWRGAFIHKNALGRMMALLALASLTSLIARRSLTGIYLACFGVATGLVVMSGSRTALAAYVGALVVLPLLATIRMRYTLAIPLVLATVSAVFAGLFWALNEVDAITLMMGRDVTLTGRTVLWQSTLELMFERPWLGYGYSAFWRGWEGASAAIWAAVPWQPPHAHNGLLDLALDLGLVGLALFGWALVGTGAKAFQSARIVTTAIGAWPLVFISFFAMVNATETTILRQNNLLWALFVAISLKPTLQGAMSHAEPAERVPARSPVGRVAPMRPLASGATIAHTT